MKELSLNILDIVENSVKAGASLTQIEIKETPGKLELIITDNGCGMSPEVVSHVIDPFYTTRTTRKVGMGVPLLKMEAEQTDGTFSIESVSKEQDPDHCGTVVKAVFNTEHIDFTPLGDTVSSMVTLIQGHPDTDFLYRHEMPKGTVLMDTRELREVLGDVPLNSYDVIVWIGEYLREQYADLQ